MLKANSNYAGTAPPIREVDWVTDITGDAVTAYSDKTLDLVQIGGSHQEQFINAAERELLPALRSAFG